MDRNSVIGLLLIGAIMVVFTYLNKPEPSPIKPQQAVVADSTQTKATPQSTSGIVPAVNQTASDSLLKRIQFGTLAPATQAFVNSPTIENDLFSIRFSSKGGTPEKIVLKKFNTFDEKELQLFDNQSLGLKIPFNKQFIHTQELYFKTFSQTKEELVLRTDGENGDFVEFIWKISPNTYICKWEARIQSQGKLSFKSLSWNQANGRKEKNETNERDNATICYRTTEGEVEKLNPIGSDSTLTETPSEWIAFKQQFFSSVIIPEKPFQQGSLIASNAKEGAGPIKTFRSESLLAQENATANFTLYFGPNHYNTLKETGHDLQTLIPLGWGIFGWVNKFLVIPVFNWLDGYALNYGIVILLLTVIIKLILLPFQYRSYMSQAKMRVLKPEMDELNKKYENEDPLKKQQAVMNLYREAGVNPLGGCLPLLLQLPILLAMFNFFPNAIELRQKSFLWAEDLSTYDSIYNLPFTIPVYGDHVSLFALLMTISTIIYTMMNNQLSGANNQMPQLKWMMYLMPVIFLFVLNSYASGLNYYYFLANIITFVQQFVFMKMVDEQKIHAKIQANKLKPVSQKTNAFQQKLEEMAKKRGLNPPKR